MAIFTGLAGMARFAFPNSRHLLQNAPLLVLAALLATVAPFWATAIPPSTDLPQHLGQIYLLEQTLAGYRQDLIVTPWFYPNTLVYWLMYGYWQIFDPVTSGRMVLSTMAAAWVGGTWLLCVTRNRPIENWLIGVPLAFNFLFSWGLLNFLIGWPIFCLFIVIATGTNTRAKPLLMMMGALLLYFAHALWFAMANLWLALLLIDTQPKQRLRLAITMAPGWILALAWYPKLAASRHNSGVDTGLIWRTMPHERLDLGYLTDAALGSLSGQIESMFVTLILAWLFAIVITNKGRIFSEPACDKPLMLSASALLLAYWALPAIYMNTIFFNQRWLPCGLTLLLISLPSPRIPKRYTIALGTGSLLLLGAATIQGSKEWEREQLGGFMDAIHQVNTSERVISLNLLDGSFHIKGRPGLQLFAYAQALRGADIHFDFTEHYSGIVQYRNPRQPNPERRLVWSPTLATPSQIAHYDKVLINADNTLHQYAKRRWRLEQVGNATSSWRLYRPVQQTNGISTVRD